MGLRRDRRALHRQARHRRGQRIAPGGGTEIVLACDLAVSSSEATYGLPEVTRGIVAAAGGLLRLPRQLPLKLAMEVALTGRPMDAATALRWGLVNQVVAPGEVLATALELATTIAANAPLAVRTSKRIMLRVAAAGSDWEDLPWRQSEEELAAVRSSQDAREGARAFAEKRPPRWSGS
jgi:crotonobetainyl-CoA hydratase